MIDIALATLIQAMPAGADPNVPRKVDLDPVLVEGPPFRRLFMDALVMEESSGLERVFHPARKYEGNPIFWKEAEWEGWGPSCGGTVIRDGDKLRMYYYCIKGRVSMAESEDGIHWTRPNLGVVDLNGSKDNNCVNCSPQVMKVANPDSPERAWVSFSNKKLAFSPDGIHWTWQEQPEDKELFSSSDVQYYFFDPYRNRFTCTWKSDGRRLRSCGVVWSEDLETWVKPYDGPVFMADDHDPDATQIYGMPVFAYQGGFIGLPQMYHARKWMYGAYSVEHMFEAQEGSIRTIDVQLSWSWDLVNWNRTPKREPFIDNPPYHAFDSGLAFTSRAPVVMGDELWFYYSGWDQAHEDYNNVDCKIGLAKLRMDGFCSMQGGDEPGWLISRREVFNTPKVMINAKCGPGGYIAAELLDRYNHVIPGFEWYYSKPFTGDLVRGELTWAKHPTFDRVHSDETWDNYPQFPDGLIDKDKKIKFYIKNADLYSYLPIDINTEIDNGWPD